MSAAAPRILHVIGSISPVRGGPSVAIRGVLKALGRRGMCADVATTDDDGATRKVVPLDQFADLEGQRVRYFPRQTRFYEASAPMLRWLAAHLRDYDVVHTHGLFGFAPIAAARIAKALGVPYIMRPAGMLDRWSRVNGRPALKRASIRLIEGPLLRDASRVHFTSRLELEQAAGAGVRLRPVILPLGLDIETSAQRFAESRFETELQSVGEGPMALYLSRIAPKKGLDVLLRAFALTAAEHPGATLLIAGEGPVELVAEYQRLATDLGLSARNVKWLGFVQGADKHWLLRRASLFVLPSKSENFGVAAAEAMAAGLPVVLTRGVALAELADEARCGIVTGGTAEETHRAMSALLGNVATRREMGLAGRRFAAEFLSLDAFGKRLEELYHQVIAERPARSGHLPRPDSVAL